MPSVGGSMMEVSMEGGLGRTELSSDDVEASWESELMRRAGAGAGRGGGSEPEESEPEEGKVEKAGTAPLLAVGRVVADEKSTLWPWLLLVATEEEWLLPLRRRDLSRDFSLT